MEVTVTDFRQREQDTRLQWRYRAVKRKAPSAFPVNPGGNLLSMYFPMKICKPPEHFDIKLYKLD